MKKSIPSLLVGPVALAALMIGLAAPPASAEITARHREFAQAVFDRLVAHVQEPTDMWASWPPQLKISEPGYANAFASYDTREDGRHPIITLTVQEIEKVAEFNADALAYTVGHELGHLLHDDFTTDAQVRRVVGGAQLTLMAVGREQELAADMYGMELALRAGYEHEAMIRNVKNSIRASQPYCSFEGLSLNHPSWEDRAAFLQRDDNQRRLWRSTSAFSNGVFFLQNEQFEHAEFCFLRVTVDFPDCYEAWANLGYARLMRYCDLLGPEELRRFDVGHLVVGGFYHRPYSLDESTRGDGIVEDLWFDAVEALREALRLKRSLGLKDDMTLVKANLAVAYLVHPSGRKDVGQAGRLFEEVFQALQDEEVAKGINPLVRAAIYVNAGAGRLGDEQLLAQATAAFNQFMVNRVGESPGAATLEAALGFTKAKALAATGDESKQRQALALLESYLKQINPACAWWPLAYEQYEQLATQLGETPTPEEKLSRQKPTAWRPVTRVETGEGLTIGLAEPITEVLERLGEPDEVEQVVAGTRIMRYRYDRLGLSVLATREVLAVILHSPAAPPVTIQRPGLGAEPVELRVGMPRAEIQGYLGDDWGVEAASLYNPKVAHQLYRDVGIAVRYAGPNVGELVVAIVPRARN